MCFSPEFKRDNVSLGFKGDMGIFPMTFDMFSLLNSIGTYNFPLDLRGVGKLLFLNAM